LKLGAWLATLNTAWDTKYASSDFAAKRIFKIVLLVLEML
jgi:hypothetical protein